jgi:hypothetical protein
MRAAGKASVVKMVREPSLFGRRQSQAFVVAAGGGVSASIGTMLVGQNEPARWIMNLLVPGRPLTGADLFVRDHYFVFDPVLVVVNLIVFSGLLYLVARGRLQPLPPQNQGKP